MDYRWKVTNTGRRSPGARVPMVAQILQRNVDVVKSMLASAAARHSLRRSGSSSQPLLCDFPDQARDDLALGLLGRFQDLELLRRQMKLDRFLHERAQLVRLDGVKL